MATTRRSRGSQYRSAQLSARKAAGSLSASAQREVAASLKTYADAVAKAVSAMPAGNTMARLAETRELMRRASRKMEQSIQQSIASGRAASFEEVLAVQRDAALSMAKAAALPSGLMSSVREPPITMMGAYASLGGEATHWETLVKGYAGRAATDADQIVSRAIAEGVGPEELARRLRPYVSGSEPFQSAFSGIDGVELKDLMAVPGLRGAASQMLHNSARIAFTEVHNARAEAEVQSFAADPFVGAIAWRLAPDRGTQVMPDECDVFASGDFYGLGAGVYPVDAVPITPHPWDRCERVPVTRPTAEAGDPKPTGAGGQTASPTQPCEDE